MAIIKVFYLSIYVVYNLISWLLDKPRRIAAMFEIGCLARFNNPYEEEVEFAIKNNLKIMQV